MKKLILFNLLFLPIILLHAQSQSSINSIDEGFYTNPIFAGDNPDPSILRDGDTYYIVHSSFEYYPGLLIWESKDLINWTPLVNALHKYVGSVWAPDLIKCNNKYYIYFPADNKIYVVWANSINGPWSDPVDLKYSSIDPGHVTDENGKRYLYFSSGGYVPLSDDGLSIVGEYKQVYSGWPIPREWSIELFALEGPKLTKHGDYYYLTVAEGGTAGPATSHMIISARSKSPFGPWENSPYNPILRTQNKAERWWSKGHGTIFEDTKGSWWMIYHAYEKDYYNMGRQTMMEPIEWTADGWFKIPDGIKSNEPIKRPVAETTKSNYTLNDNFDGKTLKLNWKFFGECDTTRYWFVDKGLVIKGKGTSVSDCSPMLCILADHSYTADVELFMEGNATGGIVLFYNNNFHSGILADKENIITDLRGWQFATEKNVIKNHVFLRLRNMENTVDMYYSLDGTNWNKTESSVEVSGLHHNVLSGFMSLRIGLCSMGEGNVTFRNFRYQAIE